MLHFGFVRVEAPSMIAASVDTLLTIDSLAAHVDIPAADSALADAGAASEVLDEEPIVEISHELGEGRASYYGAELAGRPTASGERFDPGEMTAAHPSLPFGTRLRVTNLRNGKSVVVRINDRGPFGHGRVLDLSYAAAEVIGMIRRGTARVKMEVLK